MSVSSPAEYEQAYVAPARVEAVEQRSRKSWWRTLVSIAVVILCLALARNAFHVGIMLRRDAYLYGVHYWGDILNAYRYGNWAVKHEPVLDYPEQITKGIPEYRQGKFDYPPLRLMVSYLWAKHFIHPNFGRIEDWPDNREMDSSGTFVMVEPLLNLNTAAELVSAIFVFMLIRMWKIRADDARRPPDLPPAAFRGVVAGLIGAMIFWFNPAILIDGHDWPQWDVWFFPFVLGAMLLASVDCWIGVGIVLAVGACFKGQVMLSLPIFVLWPLFRGKFGAILELAGGFAVAFAAVGLPWMRPNNAAILWLEMAGGALGLTFLFVILRLRIHWGWLIGVAIVSMFLAFPWKSDSAATLAVRILPVGIVGLLGLSYFASRRLAVGILALCLGLSTFLVIPLYGGKTYWYNVAFEYGPRKFMTMAVPGTHNLPSLLFADFRWGSAGPAAGSAGTTEEGNPLATHWVPFLGDVVIRKLLHGIQFVCLVLCGIGAAMHSRKPDTRILLALTTPMLCAFALLPQLNDRYIVWAAGLSALLAGTNAGLALIGLIISCIGWIGIAELMANKPSHYVPPWCYYNGWQSYLAGVKVHLGWIVLLSAAIYLYMIFAPTRPRRQTVTS